MPRTRDMVLFVAVGLFLLLCISVTFVRGVHTNSTVTTAPLENTSALHAAVYTASAPSTVRDRQSAIEHLRALILKNKEVLSLPDPSVESVPLDTAETDTSDQKAITVQQCGLSASDQNILQSYPLRFVAIEVKNGVRFVVYTPPAAPEAAPIAGASSSVSVPVAVNPAHILMTMPVFPQLLSKPSCVSGTIVGVTATGALLTNSDASSYLQAPTDELIGYARDGFPIYGPYDGKTDACGGYMHPEGYRYTLSKNRSFVLGCYVGTPLPFTL